MNGFDHAVTENSATDGAGAPAVKTVLVAGGAGFVGARLCQRLLASGASVICVDNLQTGRMANIDPMMEEAMFRFIRHDIIAPLEFSAPVDEIYNLACPASPPKYQLDPVHTFKTSVLGALNLLGLARNKGARILQASTSEIYGDPLCSPQPESYLGNVNPVGPRSCYDEGKRAAETLFHDYGLQHGVSIKIARIFNTYGPGMAPDDGRVVSNFIIQALRGEPITIYGNGSQTRSFCFVDDLLDGLMLLMASPHEVSYPVNLGNETEFTVAELAKLVLAKTGSSSNTIHNALPIDDPRQRRPDIVLARRVLGWRPEVSLDAGLDRTIPWFRAQLAVALPSLEEVA
ncbi:MAG: SDR family oxidoreductase [Pararhodobacter sp.]|nr:SDR family oxidoreductase [Pararhodobacter sp.]